MQCNAMQCNAMQCNVMYYRGQKIVVTYYTHARLFSSQFSCLASILFFFFVAEFPCVRLGLPMEAILDPCWRVVSEGLLGGMDTHG